MQIESVDEILPKSEKLGSDIFFAGGSGYTLGEAGTNGLFDPNNIGKVYPAPRVWNRSVGTVLPDPRSVFLEQSFKG